MHNQNSRSVPAPYQQRHHQHEQQRPHSQPSIKKATPPIEPVAASSTVVTSLPVHEAKDSIVKMISKHPVCIIVGETGSGKTTTIPQMVWDYVVCRSAAGGGALQPGIVGCTQPRRVAAVSIAKYVAKQRGVKLGHEVGYAVRFDDQTSSSTRIKFMTDGILLREIQTDPMLTKYSCILLDEAHERTLHGDVLFGLLKDLTRRRKDDLKIVVMSATLNATQFSKFWRDAPIGVVHGRSFPVTIYHTREPQADFVEAAISTVLQIHTKEPAEGDVLCFLTGQDEIEDAKRILQSRLTDLPPGSQPYVIQTLYSAMPYEQQLRVFDPAPPKTRKIILATNIAETSITVEGIKFVVDCGVVKAKSFNVKTGMESLAETDISKAQATQRTGRAGRMSAGKCFRLYTQDAFETLAENTVPEIMRCALSSVVLQMKSLGIKDVSSFDFMDKPSTEAIHRAEEVLVALGALSRPPKRKHSTIQGRPNSDGGDDEAAITPLGRALVQFPIEPSAAKALLAGKAAGVEQDVLSITAFMATENIFISSKEGKERADHCRTLYGKTTGDHTTYLNLFTDYLRTNPSHRGSLCETHSLNYRQLQKAEDTLKQLGSILHTVDVDPTWFKGILDTPVSGGGGSNVTDGDDNTTTTMNSTLKKRGRDSDDPATGGGNGGRFFAQGKREYEMVRRAICYGYFMNSAYYDVKLGKYRTVVGQQVVYLHPTSIIFTNTRKKPPLIIFHNVVETTQRYMKDVLVVTEQWLQDAAGGLFQSARL